VLTVTSTDESDLSFTATSSSSWLRVTPDTGVTVSGSQQITVSALPSGLPAGTYNGTITLTPQNGSTATVIPVRLEVSSVSLTGQLSFLPEEVELAGFVGGANPSQVVLLMVEGASTAQNFTAAASSQGGWLSVEPFSGTAPAQLIVRANLSAIRSVGTYSGTITVTSLASSQQYIVPVTLTVATEAIAAEPTSLTFMQTERGAEVPAQELQITSNVRSGFQIVDKPAWIRLGAINGVTPGAVSVWPEISVLPPGTSTTRGLIRIAGPKNEISVPVEVTLAAAPATSATPDSVSFTWNVAAATLPSQTISVDTASAVPVPFTAAVTTDSGRQWLRVTPTSGTLPAALMVSINPALVTPGRHSGTITITPADDLAQTKTIPVTLAATTPGATVHSVLHGATLVPTPVAPGQLLRITGTGLGPGVAVTARPTPAGAIDSRLADVRVLFDGAPAPLLYVQGEEIRAMAPYALHGRISTRLQVEYGTDFSLPIELKVVDAAPGLIIASGLGRGLASALNADGTLNSASNPAARGSVISVFGTGEGQTDPAGQDGRIILTDLRRPILPVTAHIGGRAAEVTYAGSAAMLVSGIFQANIRIPEDVEPGLVPVEVRIGDVVTQSGVTIAVR
jgi:uncharacterized protein (TIGR03437 family)